MKDKIKVKRICRATNHISHSKAREVVKQLKINPEICEGCNIKPCVLAVYIFGEP